MKISIFDPVLKSSDPYTLPLYGNTIEAFISSWEEKHELIIKKDEAYKRMNEFRIKTHKKYQKIYGE